MEIAANFLYRIFSPKNWYFMRRKNFPVIKEMKYSLYWVKNIIIRVMVILIYIFSPRKIFLRWKCTFIYRKNRNFRGKFNFCGKTIALKYRKYFFGKKELPLKIHSSFPCFLSITKIKPRDIQEIEIKGLGFPEIPETIFNFDFRFFSELLLILQL